MPAMTKSKLKAQRKRNAKIIRMAKAMPQVAIARRLRMSPQRVNQILAGGGARPKDQW